MANDICCKIASLRVPCAGTEDFPIWKHSSNGFFSVKSAYFHLFQELQRDHLVFPFRLIWKLPTPLWVNTFLWRVVHNRLMANANRFAQGVLDSALCLRCQRRDESIMHILRDCDCTLELWENIVNPDQWHKFASLGLVQWIEFNLRSDDVGTGD